jgi:peptidoglycan hydrolase-like protein with peptidoglycan-binding domain
MLYRSGGGPEKLTIRRYAAAETEKRSDLSGRGRLVVTVGVSGGAAPAVGATVSIASSRDAARIIEKLQTDSSGQTPEIELDSPPREYSMNTDMPKPYAEYDLNIEMEGFAAKAVKGVQVFPDAEALQDVVVNPAGGGGPEVVSIPEPVLWGDYPNKIPEPDSKDTPVKSGFVVLPEAVVPEYIVVHEGAPTNASAQNRYVPFKDYIKNVACCEIYSNWPEETLKANVLAIISFTLNRVYTEWYRSRGYSFTVTNSTAVDQAFTYGRNIFSEISVVVDEIFSTYITRPGISQPLLTQYCDGKKSQCPNWMTQWGSMDLGNKGYGAVEILKHFYGDEIYLMEAKQVAGAPSSYPGSALQTGSSGSSVREIQEQLNAISNNYPLIQKLRVDGVYGDSTRVAVSTFQKIFKAPQSGIVDFGTWYKISEKFVAVTRMAELR